MKMECPVNGPRLFLVKGSIFEEEYLALNVTYLLPFTLLD